MQFSIHGLLLLDKQINAYVTNNTFFINVPLKNRLIRYIIYITDPENQTRGGNRTHNFANRIVA